MVFSTETIKVGTKIFFIHLSLKNVCSVFRDPALYWKQIKNTLKIYSNEKDSQIRHLVLSLQNVSRLTATLHLS